MHVRPLSRATSRGPPANARSHIHRAAPCTVQQPVADRSKRSFSKCYALKGTGNWPNEFHQIIPLTGRSSVLQFIPKEVVCAIVLLVASALAVKSGTAPLPRARPLVLEDQTSVPRIESERSPCQLQLSEIAEFKSMPPDYRSRRMRSNRCRQYQCSGLAGQSAGGLLSGCAFNRSVQHRL